MKRNLLCLALVAMGLTACANFPLPPTAVVSTPLLASNSANSASGLRSANVDYVAVGTADADLPPAANPGECFVKVAYPAVYENSNERVLVKAASSRVEVTPARYDAATERVLVKPATKRLEVVPATFETVTEKVQVRPATKQLEVIPATFETVTERVLIRAEGKRMEEVPAVMGTETQQILVKPAYNVWKRSSELSIIERVARGIAADAGDVLCLVEMPAEYRQESRSVVKTPASARETVIPAEYANVTKTVQRTPPTTRETELPAEYSAITKTVQRTPATTREIEIAAEYSTVSTQRLSAPATTRSIEIPAEYSTTSKSVLKSAARAEWRQVVCETNSTPARLGTIQAALTKAGHNAGRADGVVDAATMNAVRAFQRARNLPVDNDRYINVATVRALGLSEK